LNIVVISWNPYRCQSIEESSNVSRPSQVVVVLILATSLLVSSLPGLPADAQTTGTPDLSEVEEAIARAQEYLFAAQEKDGHWDGNSFFYTASEPDLMGATAIYVLFLSHVGINNPSKRKAVEYLIASQLPDGSWGTIPGGNYYDVLALERAGVSPTSPTLQRAYEYLHRLQQQGETLDNQLFYTQFHYALAGEYPWQKVDFPLLGDSGHYSATKKPNVFRMDAALALFILKTLYAEGGTLREQRQFLRRTESLLLQRQLSNGSWFNFEQATIYALTALYELGHDTNEEHFVRGLQFLESMQFKDGSMAIFKLPVFDTTIALLALEASGVSGEREEVQCAVQWLVDSRNLAGGWGWTPEARATSDIDDTTFAALVLMEHRPKVSDEIISFILSRQNQDGGWGTFEPDFTAERDVKWVPVSSDIEFFGDPSIPDGTAHALFALGKAGYTVEDESIGRAVSFLQRVQFDNGMWFGWWGGPYIYGTSAVLVGLEAVGTDMETLYVQNAVQWLKSCQNADGGWGEDAKAREGPEYAGKGDSTSSETAWTILGLLAAHVPPNSEAIEKSILYLVSHQKDDGSWEPAPTMTATGHFPYSLEHAEASWPLWALSSYKFAIQGSKEDTETPGYRVTVPLIVIIISSLLLGFCIVFRRNFLRTSIPR